ncbi:MAG: hypothetical protein ABR998_08380 [Gemmatimonadales bacterium]|jgi:hypothetical protein
MRTASLTTWIGMSVLLLAGCATVHPDFEKYFNAEYQGHEYYNDSPDHAVWMQLAATRYGCDTMPLRTAIRDQTSMPIGVPPCDIVGAIPPGEIQAFKTPTGIREEWRFGSGARTMVVNLEGTTPRTLKTTFIQWY